MKKKATRALTSDMNINICPKSKRSELTTEQIVIIIVLIVSFAIILFFIMKLNVKETTDREICHNSVINKGKIADIASPLKCSTEYICITKDGSCEGMTNPKIFKVNTKPEIFSVLADSMYNCWWMFGEGKINYAGSDLTKHLYCSICSQIYFDNSIKTIEGLESGQLEKSEVYDYLAITQIPSKEITYSEFLYDTKDLSEIRKTLDEQSVNFGPINLDKQQYIMMGITSKVNKWIWFGAGLPVGVALTYFVPPVGIGWISGIIGAGAGGGIASVVGITVEGLSGNEYLSPSIVEVNSEEFQKLGCKSVETYA